jgi:two-component system, NtrC family, sensor kinase
MYLDETILSQSSMKKTTITHFLVLICLCLLANIAFGQTKLSPEAKKKLKAQRIYAAKYNKGEFNVYKIDSIPKDGILISRGWKVKHEDKSVFSNSNLDDSKWDTTDIDKPFSELAPIEKNHIGWFRKKILIDSSLVGKPYIFNIMITGAAEIYLNGKLIHEIGKVSLDPQKAKTKQFKVRMPYSVAFNTPGEQTLALRFLFTPHRKIDQYQDDFYPLSIKILKLEGFVEKVLSRETTDSLVTGIISGFFFMIAFIHFFFYYFFRSKKYNRSISIAMFLFGIFFCSLKGSYVNENYQMLVNFRIIKEMVLIIAHIILLNSIYEFLEYPKKLLFWLAIIFFVCLNILVFFQKIPSYYTAISFGLLVINYIFLIWKSIKNKTPSGIVMRNATIIFISIFAVFIVGLVIYLAILGSRSGLKSSDQGFINSIVAPILGILFFVGPQLSVSGAISFSLAKEFVDTNISLSQKLEEIEKLSEEKQQILSTQNEYLEKQVNQRTSELNQSLENLKITQNQLIQSEKLASLGELTAGIAHEIQNPLNFVNNFSEMSVELAQELNEELDKDSIDKGLVEELMGDLIQNQEKISHHGKRASSIVKGMLEHSRTSTGVKELTDINALADEYLRLSYHGLRAKNKSFNSDFKTDLEENLPKIAVISQDLGRVFLNLINNAFYAVGKRENGSKATGGNFKPLVLVSTKNIDNQIVISIKDNGTGMPEAVKAKIFQPFFTTKPTGEGTGLGLSLAYDIITKAHGGELKVESKEGEYTEFTIILPQQNQ